MLRCLRSLAAGSVVPTALVVDDGSSDGTAETVAREFPDAIVLRGDGNLWWTGATNVGVRHALAHGADFVLTLNSDGAVEPSTVAALLAFERTARPVLAGSLQRPLGRPDQVYSRGVTLGPTWRAWFRAPPAPPIDGDAPLMVDAIGGNSLLIPRECFEAVGLFDERGLPQNWADFDFQLRARRAGWPVYCVPGSVVWVDLSSLGLRLNRRTGVRRAAKLLTDRRSPYHLVHFPRFLFRHLPVRSSVVIGLRWYRPLVVTVAKFYLGGLRRTVSRRRT